MNVCIPSRNDRGLDAPVAEHFGHAEWFTLVDTDDGRIEARPNPGCHTGAGACQHVGLLQGLGVEAVAGIRIGRRATEALRAAGIEVLSSTAPTVAEVVDALRSGRATAFDLDATCDGHHHGHGHGDGHGDGSDHEHGHGACRGHEPRSRPRQREG